MSALPIDPDANQRTTKLARSRTKIAERGAKVKGDDRLEVAEMAATDVAVEIRKAFTGERSDCLVASKTGYHARGVTAVKNGEHEVSFQKLFAIMFAYPEIARRVEYWAGRFQQPDFIDLKTRQR